MIVEYNTVSRQKRQISVHAPLQVLSISVGMDIMVLLENEKNMDEEKMVA
jgi:hypothetical protein